jgi:hypothetical protein
MKPKDIDKFKSRVPRLDFNYDMEDCHSDLRPVEIAEITLGPPYLKEIKRVSVAGYEERSDDFDELIIWVGFNPDNESGNIPIGKPIGSATVYEYKLIKELQVIPKTNPEPC